MKGSYSISEAAERIIIDCKVCDRRGDYGRGSLLKRYGDIALPDLLALLASDCPNRDNVATLGKCGAKYAHPVALNPQPDHPTPHSKATDPR